MVPIRIRQLDESNNNHINDEDSDNIMSLLFNDKPVEIANVWFFGLTVSMVVTKSNAIAERMTKKKRIIQIKNE